MYSERAKQEGFLFYPFVLESYGAFGARATTFVRRLCEEAALHGLVHYGQLPLRPFIWRSLSVCLQQGNANLMLRGCSKVRSGGEFVRLGEELHHRE